MLGVQYLWCLPAKKWVSKSVPDSVGCHKRLLRRQRRLGFPIIDGESSVSVVGHLEEIMLRVFKRLRGELTAERRFGSYLRYASGEIVLIVIGIFLALQLNDWNDRRIRQKQVQAYAQALVGDLTQDMRMLVPVDAQIRVIMRQADELADYVRGKPISEIANADLFFLTFGSGGYRPFAWNRTALDQLKTSGALREMRNQDLARKISAYDALTHHLDQDLASDTDMLVRARAGVNRVRNLNYPEISEAMAYFSRIPDDDTEAAFFAFRSTDTFARMRARELPLLTTDRTEVDVMVNSSLEVRDAIRPRVEVEFPRLRGMADEIVALVQAEYP
jgi:hypothetical protein